VGAQPATGWQRWQGSSLRLVPNRPHPARSAAVGPVGAQPATATARELSSPTPLTRQGLGARRWGSGQRQRRQGSTRPQPPASCPERGCAGGLGAAELPATARVRQLSSPPGPHPRSAAVGGRSAIATATQLSSPPHTHLARSVALGERRATAIARQLSSPPRQHPARGVAVESLPATVTARQLSPPPYPHPASLRGVDVGAWQATATARQLLARKRPRPRARTWQGAR
jgi:hypothetical protein